MSAAVRLSCNIQWPARQRHLGGRQHGLPNADIGQLIGHTTAHTHSCVARAFDILGLGSDALRTIAQSERLWLHIDGAFGAIGALSDRSRPRLTGIKRADSLAFEFRK